MAKVIVSYDLSDEWTEVKKQLFAGGFFNILTTTSGDRVAPNTTVFISNVSPGEALRQFNSAVERARVSTGKTIRVEKIIAATMWDDWLLLSDQSS